MAAIVATTDPATGSILVTVDRRLVLDTFGRVVGPGSWGSASDVGGAYTLLGGTIATDYAVNGSVGQMTLGTTVTERTASLLSGLTDMTMRVDIVVPVNPTGDAIEAGFLIRNAGLVSYRARIRLNTNGNPEARVLQRQRGHVCARRRHHYPGLHCRRIKCPLDRSRHFWGQAPRESLGNGGR
jgi:hypothetical protein